MADRAAISGPANRFKPCKVRVHCVSTSGRKTTKNINLKVSSLTKQTVGIGLFSESVSHSSSKYGPHGHSQSQEQETKQDFEQGQPDVATRYQIRREREYENWKQIREALLNGCIEEEAFFPEQKCRECGIALAEVRCIDCGYDQHFCIGCAKRTHEERNYFHVLERFKVRKCNCHTFLKS